MIVTVVIAFKQLQIKPKKNSGSQRDSNPWPLRSAAVLFQLSYEDAYTECRPTMLCISAVYIIFINKLATQRSVCQGPQATTMTTGTKTSLKKRSRALQTLSRLFLVLHVQGCCFANLTIFFFLPFSLTSPSSILKLPDDKDRLRY